MKTTDSIIVAFDRTSGKDHSVLVVGRKDPKQDVKIINAFAGEEAEELYKKLVTRKEKKDE